MKYILFFVCFVTRVMAQHPLEYESNQSIWLLNSNNTFASTEDSIIDRHFFEARTITIQSLEPFPPDVSFECSAYLIDTTQANFYPQMTASFSSPQLPQKMVNHMLSVKHDMLFLIRVMGDKQGDEYKFVGSMKFQLAGEPKQMKKPKTGKVAKISLVNSKGKKIKMQDTAVSRTYFRADWVDLNLGHTFDSGEVVWVVIQPIEGPGKAIKMISTHLPEEARASLAKEAVGSKVFFIHQRPDRNQGLKIALVLLE
jgi:hypothetical protein